MAHQNYNFILSKQNSKVKFQSDWNSKLKFNDGNIEIKIDV